MLQLTVEAGAGVPLHRQVRDGLRSAILAGRLAPGARLPSSRSLASDLGVARNTVLQAFEQLRSEGYITGRRGGGTRVRPTIPDELLSPGVRVGAGGSGTPAPGQGVRPGVARRAVRAVAHTATLHSPGGAARAFDLGVPALDAFPVRVWSRLEGRRWRRGGVSLSGGAVAGEGLLREAIAAHVGQTRDGRCTAEQVLVVSGAQQALNLVAQVLLDPGDRVWLEEPGYPGARAALDLAGAEIVPVPVDADGLDVAAGECAAPDARAVCVTPSHQFPLGSVLGVERRLALLERARRTGSWIIEDDYDSEYRYAGRPLACLQGLDARHADGAAARVIYIGTFSKTLAPAFRLGYLVVPEHVVDAFRAVRAATDIHPPIASQRVLADFIEEGHYARHVRRVRAIAAERQAVLLDAAARRLGGLLELTPDPAGLHLVGRLAGGIGDVQAATAAAAAGVHISALSRYRMVPHAGENRVLLGYAGYDERQIRDGVDRLAGALAGLRPAQP